MMHRLRRYDVFRFAQNDVAPVGRNDAMFAQCAARHASLGAAVIIGVANIICRRQTSFKKRTFVGRQIRLFCCLKSDKRSKIEVKANKRSTFSCCLLDKLEIICRHLSILLCTANHPRPINSVVRHLINKHLPTPLINEFLQAR